MENTKNNRRGVYKNDCISPSEEKEQLTFIDFFAGVGGFRRGLELAGWKCVGFCEFDKYATASYTSMHLITEEQRKYLESLSVRRRQKEILKEEYRNGEWYISDIRDANAGNLPKADCWCFGAPCFVKGTLITTHRGLVPIEEIKAGDKVLTHKNQFQKVIKPMINIKQGIYTLKVQGSPNTEVTGNHRFYVRDKQRVWNNSLRRYETIISEPYWKEVQNFNGKELIQFTVNPYDKNIYELTEEECWLIGRYVADGYIRDDQRKDRPSRNQRVIFCIGKGKEQEFENNSSSFNMYTSEGKNCKKYITGNKRLFSLCKHCGRGAKNKIIPQFIMDLNPHLLNSFISGYLSGDGSYSNGVWKATSISKKLIYQLGQCISKSYQVGYSIHYTKRPKECQIENRVVNQNDTWQIVFRPNLKKSLSYYIDDTLWQSVKEIKYEPERKEIVYNMEVENDNSYTANNMGVHNCQDFSVAGKRAGLDGDRSSLIREIFRLLEEQEEQDRPEWFIYENVKGMLSSNKGLDYLSILSEMDRLGYDIEWQNINSKWFVPQNRERIYTVGHLRRFGSRKVFPIEGTGGENSISIIAHRDGYRRNTQTFSADGIMEALDTGQGGGRGHHVAIPCFIDMNYGAGIKLTENARTLQSRYYKGISNHAGETSGVAIKIIGEVNSSQDGQIHDISGISKCHSVGHNNSPKVAIPVLTPDRVEKRQNGRRFKENGEPMFTLTAQDRHGVVVAIDDTYGFRGTRIYEDAFPTLRSERNGLKCGIGIIDPQGGNNKEDSPKNICPTLRSETHRNVSEVVLNIKEATKKGYDEAHIGDSINLAVPGSKTRRGRVGHQIAQTLDTSCNQGTLIILMGDEPGWTDENKGIYVEMPEGFVVYAVWCEKYQCYITIRKLTPKECFRLQGWTDDYFERAAFVNSDSQLYKQAGNGVTVDVVKTIGDRIVSLR